MTATTAHTAPICRQPEMRRHTGRNRRLCSGTVRSDLPRRILIIAHGGSIDLSALAASVGIARPPHGHGAPLSWTIERADTSFVCERVRKAVPASGSLSERSEQ